jgi:hypothetical protein
MPLQAVNAFLAASQAFQGAAFVNGGRGILIRYPGRSTGLRSKDFTN